MAYQPMHLKNGWLDKKALIRNFARSSNCIPNHARIRIVIEAFSPPAIRPRTIRFLQRGPSAPRALLSSFLRNAPPSKTLSMMRFSYGTQTQPSSRVELGKSPSRFKTSRRAPFHSFSNSLRYLQTKHLKNNNCIHSVRETERLEKSLLGAKRMSAKHMLMDEDFSMEFFPW